MSRTLTGLRLLHPDGDLRDGSIVIADGRIASVGWGAASSHGHDLAGGIVLPGFVDIHCHGGGGTAYASGDPALVSVAAQMHRKHGTTTSIASLVSASYSDLSDQVRALIPLVDDGTFCGIHLEGPWISRARCGAHDPAALCDPLPADVARMLEVGEGRIAMVTIAPELPGALESIQLIVDSGAVAAVGHTAASFDVTRNAVDAGATVATHLFNGMPPMQHREPGPVGALLADPRVTLELIADGVHVAPDVLRIAMAAAPGRCALITDAMAAAGAGDGDYVMGGLAVRVDDGVARLARDGGLAGSTLTLDVALRNMVESGHSLAAVSASMSAIPARALGLTDRGTLEASRRADLVVLDDRLSVQAVMRGGEWVR